jgi:hypothetical protein
MFEATFAEGQGVRGFPRDQYLGISSKTINPCLPSQRPYGTPRQSRSQSRSDGTAVDAGFNLRPWAARESHDGPELSAARLPHDQVDRQHPLRLGRR